MKTTFLLIFLVFALSAKEKTLAERILVEIQAAGKIPDSLPGEFLAEFTPEFAGTLNHQVLPKELQQVGVASITRISPISRVFKVEFSQNLTLDEARKRLGELAEMVEPNAITVQPLSTNTTTSTATKPTYLDALNVASLRSVVKPSVNIRVGIIGTGIACDHPVFQNKINREASHSYIDNQPCMDNDGHETLVAGVVDAVAGERIEFVSLKITTPLPTGKNGEMQLFSTLDAVLAAFYEVASWEVPSVVNASVVFNESRLLNEAIYALKEKGFISMAAGNNGTNPVTFPCFIAYDTRHGLCVASAELTGEKASYSNWGPRAEIVGFGSGVSGAHPREPLQIRSGTSFAAPQAAGIAVLLRRIAQQEGIELTPALLKKLILLGGQQNPKLIGFIGNKYYMVSSLQYLETEGLQLNGGRALEVLRRLQAVRLINTTPATARPGSVVTILVSEDINWLTKFELAVRIKSENNDLTVPVSLTQHSLQFLAPPAGNYRFSLVAEGSIFSNNIEEFVVALPQPQFKAEWVVNATDFTSRLWPGAVIVIFGLNLAPSEAVADNLSACPTTLNGVSVVLGGTPAPVCYVSPTQINLVVPPEMAPGGDAWIRISRTDGGTSQWVRVIISDPPQQ